MVVDERRRSGLYTRLVDALGAENADTMFELMPPERDELATRTDLREFRAEVDDRFAQVDVRFDHLEERLDDRFERLRSELLAAFRSELVAAVSGQTRAVTVATATATLGIGGLAVTLAQVL